VTLSGLPKISTDLREHVRDLDQRLVNMKVVDFERVVTERSGSGFVTDYEDGETRRYSGEVVETLTIRWRRPA
jgi:hypothetical protein